MDENIQNSSTKYRIGRRNTENISIKKAYQLQPIENEVNSGTNSQDQNFPKLDLNSTKFAPQISSKSEINSGSNSQDRNFPESAEQISTKFSPQISLKSGVNSVSNSQDRNFPKLDQSSTKFANFSPQISLKSDLKQGQNSEKSANISSKNSTHQELTKSGENSVKTVNSTKSQFQDYNSEKFESDSTTKFAKFQPLNDFDKSHRRSSAKNHSDRFKFSSQKPRPLSALSYGSINSFKNKLKYRRASRFPSAHSTSSTSSSEVSSISSGNQSTDRPKSEDSIDRLRREFFSQLNQRKLDYPTYRTQIKLFCRQTYVHGYRYIYEAGRSKIEKFFWFFFCLLGFFVTIYTLWKTFIKWEQDSVITSVSDTNFPVSGLYFPAVTVCTINKAVAEKLIIQGCRFNYTYSQMKNIISSMIDPEERNNEAGEEIKIEGRLALKYLKLVAPKCEDFLIRCRWNSYAYKCTHLFKLTLTDTGYCCTFNSAEAKIDYKAQVENKFGEANKELLEEFDEQEKEYLFLQQAVWDYTDDYRKKTGTDRVSQVVSHQVQNLDSEDEDSDEDTNSTTVSEFTCPRYYADDLFPGICRYLNRCRQDPKACNLEVPEETDETDDERKISKIFENFPLNAVGAGRTRGLTIMSDTLRCDQVPTGSFKGLRIGVHHPDQFPIVGDRGFVVGPGQEANVAVSAYNVITYDELRAFLPEDRGCYFQQEFPLKYFSQYSKPSCIIECENEWIYEECECAPFFAPGNYSLCSKRVYLDCGKKALDAIQKRKQNLHSKSSGLGLSNLFSFTDEDDDDESSSCNHYCLPACYETSYQLSVSSAPFPNQNEPNQTKLLREAILEGHTTLNDINYVRGSVSTIRIYFRSNSAMQYKRHEFYSWVQFVSNLGSIIKLFMGLSFLGVWEFIYFLTLRLYYDRRINERENAIFLIPKDPNFHEKKELERRGKWWFRAWEACKIYWTIFTEKVKRFWAILNEKWAQFIVWT